MQMTDYGSLRARAGWVFSNFLPYGFAGFALGRGSYSVTSLVFGQQTLCNARRSFRATRPIRRSASITRISNSISKTNTLLYGFSVGGGVDVALTSNIFLRAEYEYIQFAPFASITATISSARIGAGLKF